MSLKSLTVAGIVGGVALGAIAGAAAVRLPSGASAAVPPVPVSRAISPQPPFSPSGKPGPIIWDSEQLSTAPLDVQRAWITPYTIRDGYTGRVVFSPSQRGGE